MPTQRFCWNSSTQRQLAVHEKWESYCSRKARYEATYISWQKTSVLQTLALRVAALKTRAQVMEVRSKSLSRCCLPFSWKRENSVKTAVKPYLFWSPSRHNFVQGGYFWKNSSYGPTIALKSILAVTAGPNSVHNSLFLSNKKGTVINHSQACAQAP